jgi:hypothetical protein
MARLVLVIKRQIVEKLGGFLPGTWLEWNVSHGVPGYYY